MAQEGIGGREDKSDQEKDVGPAIRAAFDKTFLGKILNVLNKVKYVNPVNLIKLLGQKLAIKIFKLDAVREEGVREIKKSPEAITESSPRQPRYSSEAGDSTQQLQQLASPTT